jgi:hypothetical protein
MFFGAPRDARALDIAVKLEKLVLRNWDEVQRYRNTEQAQSVRHVVIHLGPVYTSDYCVYAM